MPLFKVAVKNKNVEAIVRIIETGENWIEDEALNTIHTIHQTSNNPTTRIERDTHTHKCKFRFARAAAFLSLGSRKF